MQAWTSHLATITQLRDDDAAVGSTLEQGPNRRRGARAARPTPAHATMLAANLASITPVLITYRPDLEQLLVLRPLATAMM